MESTGAILKRANDVLDYNPLVANIDITTHASDWLWAVFAVMLVSAMALFGLSFTRPAGQRAFHELAAAICFTASIAYFAMASDLGATAVPVEFIRGGTLGQNWVDVGVQNPTRSIWYARYIDWTITTPLLLLELAFTTGLPLSQIFILIFMDLLMIVTGLIGALVPSVYKWGFFAFGCAALVVIWYMLLGPGRASAARLGSDFSKAYMTSTIILSVLWLLYPIAWGVADGGNVITPTSEMVFYGVLDLFAKPVYCFIHVFAVSRLDYNRLGFTSGKYSDGANPLLNEKNGNYSVADTPRASMAPSSATGANHPATTGTPAFAPRSGINDGLHSNRVVETA
ncbi:opsin family protein [Sporobolomyces koalae]|uniref:opsin family protein n=1 Tax=Sporobolomyces koalae TaxID=500713 RepID=UPI003172E338